MTNKTKEPTAIIYIRVPIDWHGELARLAKDTGNNIGSILRPYIFLALEDLKEKYNHKRKESR